MAIKKESIRLLKRVVVGCFFIVITLFSILSSTLSNYSLAYAVESETETATQSVQEVTTESQTNSLSSSADAQCKKSFGAIGWIVCPATAKIAEAVDFLYGALENILIVEPIKIEDGTPIYEIWKYCRGLTNVIFIIMLLVAIYSQITGLGISNYGIKRALPKLIVAAILINLSFIICSLLVDTSNIVGNGARGLFTTIEETVVYNDAVTEISMGELLTYAAGGGVGVFGLSYAWHVGALFFLVPALLGVLVSILIGIFTIAMRQAVLALLVMIAPLAIIANVLPNTENLFKRWKSTLIQMLVFYPMFSLLIGASNLAGLAIIVSSKHIFGVILGAIVRIMPLFFSARLMQMSNTVLGSASAWMRGLANRPLAATQGWAMSHAMHKRQKTIASGSKLPSVRLIRFLDSRRQQREIETGENIGYIRNRAMAAHAKSHYNEDGTVSKKGERAYRMQADSIRFQNEILRDRDNFNRGLGDMGRNEAQTRRLRALDGMNAQAAMDLHAETVRGERIKYDNAKAQYERLEKARDAHLDDAHGYDINPTTGERTQKSDWTFYPFGTDAERDEARAQYNRTLQIMDNDDSAVEHVTAVALQNYAARQSVMQKQIYGDILNIPQQHYLRSVIADFCSRKDAAEQMDMILPGFRVLSDYKDFSVIIDRINDIAKHDVNHDGLTLGTHAAQSLANFLMFEVGDRDPVLRKFGNYLNLEAIRLFDSKDRRTNKFVNYSEYLLGHYMEPDPDNPGQEREAVPKKSISELLKGMTFDKIEGSAFDSYEASLREAFTTVDENGNKTLDVEGYLKRKGEIEDIINEELITSERRYPSGSDQLAGSMRLKTGYLTKRDPDTGKIYIVPIWEDQETLQKYGMTGYEDMLRDHYQERTKKFLKGMSPSQILAIRSAYQEPLTEHLSSAYEDSDTEGWTDEEIRERASLLESLTTAEEEYNQLPDGDEKDQAMTRIKSIKNEMAGVFLRRMLDEGGTLGQIYATRRSGAANNAKSFLRNWLHLDASSRNKNPRRDNLETADSSEDSNQHDRAGDISPRMIQDFIGRMANVRQDNMASGGDLQDFYNALVNEVRENFASLADYPILSDLERYYTDNRETIDQQDLIDKLADLLHDNLSSD
ncbi:hypothetical protein IKG10_00225 [Candidatus Saccharibacteria bacterium]|nr:hypothetical protein [Candidatus Saccharibacteria bacterium]